ncbi:MAG: glycosyl transferase, partial [Chitinophagaceae bacterium]|nr:glycosyl transferase [Chitinophagaceae bacterium]
MRIAHLILVHKNPHQLTRLIQAMTHPAFDFYIHIDKKADARLFDTVLAMPNVYAVVKRTKIYWAGYGTIQATINGFEAIIPKGYDYINVMSGQDFPLKTPPYIHDYINERRGKEFITCEAMDGPWNVADRVRNYHLVNWRIPGKYKLEKLANRFLPKRTFPFDYEIVGRANWFTLTNDAARFVIDFIHQHPKIVRYFKYCWGADEFMFSSILFNSPLFRDKIADNLTYVDWSEGNPHPKLLSGADVEALTRTDKLFGRKF